MTRLPFKLEVTAEHDGCHHALEIHIVVKGLSREGLAARGHASAHGWFGADIVVNSHRP
jgi:hypothetical protein